MNDDLIQQLLLEGTGLLDAMQNGPQMFASYCQTTSALSNAFLAAVKTEGVGTRTTSLAYSVASRISIIASCFLEVRRHEDLVTAQFQRDCDAVLSKVAALDLNTLQPDDRQETRSLSYSSIPTCRSSSFLAVVHQWLLDNLHNPYPTAEVKAWMATASSCQVSSINSWFINARRRIGWTTLCRDHFSNCRSDMINAAYRALVEEDPQRALPSELRHSFITMKVAAEGLYLSTLTRSVFAGDLDAIGNDTAEEDKVSAGADKGNFIEVQEIKHRKPLVTECENLQAVRDSYPSPDPSTTASPVPALSDSFTDEGEEEEDVAPPIIAGCKRRRSSTEPDNQRTASRPIKRLRASATSWACLPSPSSSTDRIDVLSDDGSPVPSSTHLPPAEANQALSPRLSDPDATGMPKHPSDLTATPHFHTVSDPLPCFHVGNNCSVDDWFSTNFDDLFAIPPPVEATKPDLSASWEVELFKDYSIPGNPKYTMKCPPAPDSVIAAPTDLPDIDSLLRSFGGDTFTTPSNVLPPDIIGAPYAVPFNSSIPVIPQTNIDWTSLFNDTERCQPTVYSTFPQYPTNSQPLPETDLFMLQLPCVAPVANSQDDFTSRRAKLHQLHVMQDAVRRMEQELRSEGVVL